MSDTILQITPRAKLFGSLAVLRDFDFSGNPGDVTSLIGPSGSGKSTLLRCINLLETPTSGEILYHGTNIKELKGGASAYRSHVGMVFQSFNLFNNMNALKNCMIGQMKVLGKSKQEAKESAMHYLEKVGMEPYINAKASLPWGGATPGGARARARALEPEVLLFADRSSALDPQMVGEVLSVMRDLAKEGLTMIVVTHEMAFARDVSNNVVFMTDGVICESGSPEEIFESPKKAETKDFLSRFLAN